ncbi:hypothetical protein XNW1_4590001 [Xenorhabdus nematophila str. Websteri]|nr:hypothetical protein XNW1_1320001 [Xenorhabdus nematophila str. Websteri]CEF32972.1 hypothetical protein XNW1_4590001 [Xenorhabdus nematophila str. Websteri]
MVPLAVYPRTYGEHTPVSFMRLQFFGLSPYLRGTPPSHQHRAE